MKFPVVLAAACSLCLAAHAQRMSVAPEAFLDDVKTVASAGKLGGLLLPPGARRVWGEYCVQSQGLSERGEFRQAIRTATKALYLGQQGSNWGAPLIYSMHDIAMAYSYAGDWATALTWADRSLEAISKGYEPSFRTEVLWIGANLRRIRALAYDARGDRDAAIVEIQKALDAAPRTGAAPLRLDIELAHAMLLLRSGKHEDATRIAERLLRENEGAQQLGPARVAGEAALARGDAAAALRHFDTATAAATTNQDRYQVVMAGLGRARALRKAGKSAEAGEQFRASLHELEAMRRAFHSFEMRAALFGNLQSVFDEAVEFHLEQGNAAEALEASEAGRARAMLDLQGKVEGPARAPVGRPRSVKDIQASLQGGTHMVVYHQLPDQLVAWRLGADSIRVVRLPDTAAPAMHKRVETLRLGISRLEPGVQQQARELHRALVAPLDLPANAPVVFVPHRSLHLLPFQALHDGNQWLVEKHPVATALSASLYEANAFKVSGAALAAVGNPDLGREEWALPGAEREVAALAPLYPSAKVFVRAQATKAQLVGAAPGAQVVHVAAHAVLDDIDPMYSVVKLAVQGPVPSAAAQPTDLQARELAAMDLSKAELVSLSACNSGVGTIAQGDEFMGFKRAVMAAGARTALVSLWPVEDDATEMLMKGFHQAWREGSRVQALRKAQLTVLRDPRFAHPYYWAPFVLVGDAG